MRMLLSILLVIAITALVLAFNPKPKIILPPDAHAGDLTLEPCDYKIKTAPYKAECGTLIVPENRLNPPSRLLALPVKRIHAESNSPLEPIFYLGGGPGMSNMKFEPPLGLLKNHDVVMVGYRGVDGSSVLDCPEFSKATLGDGHNVLSDESLAIMTDAVRACRASMQAAGVDLSGYTIQQVVEDSEAARVPLGYGKINSTPAQYATNELLPSLTRGKQIILSEMGHVGDVWGVQPEATLRLLTSFYDTGVADDSLYTYAPMDLHVSLGFPALAKISLGTGAMIVAVVVAALWALARRLRTGKVVASVRKAWTG